MIRELCRQEVVRLFAYRYIYVLVMVMVLMQALRMVTMAAATAESTLDVVSAPQLWAEGLGWGLRVLVFLVLVVGAMGFSQEFSLGTAKTMLVLPVTRRAWFASKLLFLLGLAWALLLLLASLGVIITAVALGWADVARESYVIYAVSDLWDDLALAVVLTAAFLAPLCALALLVGLHFNNAGAAVGVAVLLGVVLEAVGGLADWGRFLFSHHLTRPAAVVGKMGRGLAYQWAPQLETGLPVALITFALLTVWALVRLEHMDVTQ